MTNLWTDRLQFDISFGQIGERVVEKLFDALVIVFPPPALLLFDARSGERALAIVVLDFTHLGHEISYF